MADLPDYYTQAQISEAEAASFKGGLDANKSPTPVSRQIYYATDTKILYVCVVDGVWININSLYLLLAGGTMTGNIAMGSNRITGLPVPTTDDEAARKKYVDDQISGDVGVHEVKTTGIHGVGASTIDSVANRDTAIATHAALKAAAAVLGHVIVEAGSDIDVDAAGKLTLGGHKVRHENAGDDEISVAGLSGLLADDQHVLDAEVLLVAAALVHAARHQNGGDDEISVAGLSGLLADDQHVLDAEVLAVAAALVHKTRHQNGGADEISVAGLSGLLADDQHVLDAEVTAAVNAAGVALASGKNIKVIQALTSDHTASGLTAVMTAGTALGLGHVCYIGPDSKLEKAYRGLSSQMPAICIVTETIAENATGEVLLQGFIRDDGWDWTIGGLFYVSSVPGGLTQAIPSGSGDLVQVLGIAITADIIYFNTSFEMVEVA